MTKRTTRMRCSPPAGSWCPPRRRRAPPAASAGRQLANRTRSASSVMLPVGCQRGRQRSDPVTAIARASRVRVRPRPAQGRLVAPGERSPAGFPRRRRAARRPLAGFRIALRDGRCHTLRPATPVTAAKAAELHPFAYAFYRPFAAKSLTAWELFRFSIKGSQRDWAAVVLFGLAGGLLGLFLPIVTGWIFDWIIPGAEHMSIALGHPRFDGQCRVARPVSSSRAA